MMACPRSTNRTESRATAFTLIELLVVISIISLLIALLLPALAGARSSARAVQCASYVRAITQMSLIYSADHKDYMISAYAGSQSPYGATAKAHYEILPTKDYLGGGANALQTKFRCPDITDAVTVGAAPYWGYAYPINAFVSIIPGGFPGTPRALRVAQVKSPGTKVFYGDGMGTVNGVAGYNVYGDTVMRRHNSSNPLVAAASATTVVTDWDKRTANLSFIDGHAAFDNGALMGRFVLGNSMFYRDNLYIGAQGGNYP